MNEQAMTVKDWEWLMLLSQRGAREAKRANALVSHEYYEALADKCRTRADALREGRVMP